MNRFELNDLLSLKKQASSKQVDELRVLCDTFPWFEAAHFALARALYQHNADDFESRLAKIATVVSNRKQLKEFILAPAAEDKKPSATKAPQVVPSPVKEEVAKEVESKPKAEPKEEPQAPAKAAIQTEEKPSIVSDKEESKEVSPQAEEKQVPEKTAAQVKPKEDAQPAIKKEETLAESKTSEPQKSPAATVLQRLQEIQKEQEERKEAEEKAKEEASKPISRGDKLQIIDQFIQSDHRIKPREDEFKASEEMAINSLAENEDFISETLADIYIKQGNIAKGIKILKALSLKFPEKSAYFAGRIEKLSQK